MKKFLTLKINLLKMLKLDWNESTFDFPVDLKTKALMSFQKIKLNHYPDLKNKRLKRALSKFLGIDETNLTIFNGSIQVSLQFVDYLSKKKIVSLLLILHMETTVQ